VSRQEAIDLLQALSDRLLAEGCLERSIAIEGSKTDNNHDVFRLAYENDHWTIRYWERGKPYQKIFKSQDLERAIEGYEAHIMSLSHLHMVARTPDLNAITEVEKQLSNADIESVRNDLPASQFGTAIYRAFVKDSKIFHVEAIFGRRILLEERIAK